ncbi:MAG: hypothetical protein WC647_18970 [Desulfomonilaceae bacterium]|jgi:hypothetical protein
MDLEAFDPCYISTSSGNGLRHQVLELFQNHCLDCVSQGKPRCCFEEELTVFFPDEWKQIEIKSHPLQLKLKKRILNMAASGTVHLAVCERCLFHNPKGCQMKISHRPLDCITYPVYPMIEFVSEEKRLVGMMIHKKCKSVDKIIQDTKLISVLKKLWNKEIAPRPQQEIKDWFNGIKKDEYLLL